VQPVADQRSSNLRAEQYLSPDTLGQLAPFELRAKMVVEGVMSGMHRSPYQGLAVEFAQHRQYVPGDNIRHLDWKVYGRSDKLYLKQYQQETNLDVMVLVDCSASMRFGTLPIKGGWGGTTSSRTENVWTKFDHAAASAVAIAYLCLAQQDRVGLVMYAEGVRGLIRRSSAKGQWRSIVQSLSTHPVEAATDIVHITDQVLGQVGNRALFIIISDFLEPTAALRKALARFRHRRHDVVLLQVLDRQELKFEFTEPAPFEGLEGEGRVRVDPRALRPAYLQAMQAHLDETVRVARGFGFDYQRMDSHESVGPGLAAILARRNAFIKRSKAG
jgi:uncharacterized protein (DUF58 family)